MKTRHGFVSNSSSSSFICDTELNEEGVEQELRKMLAGYNMMMDTSYTFENCFIEPYRASGIPHEDWKDCYPILNNANGKIIIDSVSDNSIPYGMFLAIESKLNAVRCHLG